MKEFIKNLPLFHGLSDLELDEVLALCKEKEYKSNELITREGDRIDSLYIIKKGSAEVLKGNLETDEVEFLSAVHPGEWVGEMSFIEDSVTTASVRVVEPSSVIIFSIKSYLASKEHEEVSKRIMRALAQKLSVALRKENESRFSDLLEKMSMTRLLIGLYIVISFYLVVFKFIAEYKPDSSDSAIIVGAIILFLAVASVHYIFRAKLPLEFYGITSKNWLRNVRDGILWSIPVLIFGVFLKWVAVHSFSFAEGMPIFQLTTEGWGLILLYIGLVPLQEFLVRGLLQGSFRIFFRGSHRIFYSILTSNLIFEMFHNAKSFSFSILVFFTGIFWGYMYEQQKSLVGPIVSHLIVGSFSIFFLNAEEILRF